MEINKIHLPTFTDNDLEWINKQPQFYLLLNDKEFGIPQLLAKYGLFSQSTRSVFIEVPTNILSELNGTPVQDIFYEICDDLGFGKQSNNPLDRYNLPYFLSLHKIDIGSLYNKPRRVHLIFFINTVDYGQACSIGYCKQFDCNIGMAAAGKWMSDTEIYLLPKDFHDVSIDKITNNGIFVGSQCGARYLG